MPIELDIFNKQILANKAAYETIKVALSSDLPNLAPYITTSEVRTLSSTLIRSTSTLETPTTGISAVNNIVSLSQATYNALTVKLPTTLYVIV